MSRCASPPTASWCSAAVVIPRPIRPAPQPKTCPIPSSPTPTARPSDRNAMSPGPSEPSESASLSASSLACPVAPAVTRPRNFRYDLSFRKSASVGLSSSRLTISSSVVIQLSLVVRSFRPALPCLPRYSQAGTGEDGVALSNISEVTHAAHVRLWTMAGCDTQAMLVQTAERLQDPEVLPWGPSKLLVLPHFAWFYILVAGFSAEAPG